jgi:hypothetical protein
MAFVVPALGLNVNARYHFGACRIPMSITDPGGAPAAGIVYLRGAVARSPQGNPNTVHPGNLLHLFTLPPGMRPVEDRWLTCQLTTYVSMCDGKPTLCIVRKTGEVHVEAHDLGYDGAVFFDGLSFLAEGSRRPRTGRVRSAAKAPRKASRR